MGGGFGRGGGLGRGPVVLRRGGGGGIGMIIILLIVLFIFGVNPLDLLTGGGNVGTGPTPQEETGLQGGADDEMGQFVATVLADTEDVWTRIFDASGQDYPEPTLTLFSNFVASACGTASSASGPFYCPGDQDVYIDLEFYRELRERFGAPGDFAQAYVLAHEVGHHVQNVTGQLNPGGNQAGAEGTSVRTELQADCYAGIWANHTEQQGLLEAGDIEEALNAAAAIGDDTIQRQSGGGVVPDSFTHGTSAQRQEWFMRGYESGNVDDCDTFNADI
jgi:predicted metalloprotease